VLGGDYAERYSLPVTVFVDLKDLAGFPDLEALRQWLLLQGGEPLGPASAAAGRTAVLPAASRLAPLILADVADAAWVERGQSAVESVLRAIVNEFLEAPYLHRVEHSLHTQLWAALGAGLPDPTRVRFRTGELTQLVHKEWPETRPRPTQDGSSAPRGLFDLALLSPQQVASATLAHFTDGRIEAPLVIEVGLDYGARHLQGDIWKLTNSDVPLPYLLHLSRVSLKDDARDEIERLVLHPGGRLRCAYAHLDPRTGAVRWKHLDEDSITFR